MSPNIVLYDVQEPCGRDSSACWVSHVLCYIFQPFLELEQIDITCFVQIVVNESVISSWKQ